MKPNSKQAQSKAVQGIFGVMLCCVGIIALCFNSLPISAVGVVFLVLGSCLMKE